jgi:excinuclease ABC subunit A
MIRISNVRVNNLKDVSLEIPAGQLMLFCGLSGSGKSSLALDTLYAEGQRRYIECLSPRTRQYVAQWNKPDADAIEGVPPAIAVQALRGNLDRKSTVGTVTQVVDYLQLLFTEAAKPFCPDCEQPIEATDPGSITARLIDLPAGHRLQITFPVSVENELDRVIPVLRQQGWSRAIINNQSVDLDQPGSVASFVSKEFADEIEVVVDRLKTGTLEPVRTTESLEIACQAGNRRGLVLIEPGAFSDLESAAPPKVRVVDGRDWMELPFSSDCECPRCGIVVPLAEPQRFNHRQTAGACDACAGIGFVDKLDREPCLECRGTRLGRMALAYRLPFFKNDSGDSIEWLQLGQLQRQPIGEVADLLSRLQLTDVQRHSTRWLRQGVESRLEYLSLVGLEYLQLGRSVRTLSAGEAQRAALTGCLSSNLVNALYVLDEPSVGLHVHDIERLLEAIRQLHQRDNTVVLVDHRESVIRAVDRVVEVGPGAGAEGGNVVFDGTPQQLEAAGKTVTADFLAGRRGVSFGDENRRSPRGALRLVGARGHNLKNIDVEFPLGCLTVVSGVSGSGKSTLVQQTLYGAVCKRKQVSCDPPLPYDDLFGDSQFDEIVLVDRTPVGRSARSNPVTYVKAFDEIRRCFADTVDAKTHNLNVSKFSFNAAGGRCDKCEGTGQLTIDMQFLPPVRTVCDACGGTRFRDEVLAVKYRGRNIAQVLTMTARQAFSFFRGQPKVQAKLKALLDVGLGYLQLGQPATTLSAGEAQRLKLAVYLNASKSRRAVFLLDEPTSGLHMADVTRLLDCFDSLIDVGHSLIVVEHHLRLIRSADWVIDLGPGAGDSGGSVVASGTPDVICNTPNSLTGKAMKKL